MGVDVMRNQLGAGPGEVLVGNEQDARADGSVELAEIAEMGAGEHCRLPGVSAPCHQPIKDFPGNLAGGELRSARKPARGAEPCSA